MKNGKGIWNCRNGVFARKISVGKLASKAYAILGFLPLEAVQSGNLRITAIGNPKSLGEVST
ncbi:hypothetical protein MKY19_04740 [Paenibacillus sp. FSL R5-0744]|uniref:hypothetical protein n=1 Tax=Paenibacillus sp. FSL R5-0744 TaxID=2921656 RepID=UPI00097B343F|nr:hypothetical protein BSK50_20160 [Paenibacillus odorifer]